MSCQPTYNILLEHATVHGNWAAHYHIQCTGTAQCNGTVEPQYCTVGPFY